ncbi:MAG: deoxyhypusine synthase family protein [Desulfohalobiaceae bacterium]
MDKQNQPRRVEHMADPDELGLTPLQALDPDQVEDVDQLLGAMSQTAFGGRKLGEALDVLQAMVQDPECHVVATMSGAMTVAKMSKIICTMIEQRWIDSLVSTGALMAHGFIESIGLKHYKYQSESSEDDQWLCRQGLNRVYDTLEPERNFMEAEKVLSAALQELVQTDRHICSQKVCQAVGRHLSHNYEGRGVLKSAFENDVSVYIPAFTDSELALDMAMNLLSQYPEFAQEEADPGQLPFQFNPFLDLFHYTRRVMPAKKLGIFTIGGGVPRNWAQQLGPFVELTTQKVSDVEWQGFRRFHYGVRICPEPDHWGGLSGCSYQEGISWGKFVSPQEGGRFSEVHCDATIAWPILIKGLQQRLAKQSSGE